MLRNSATRLQADCRFRRSGADMFHANGSPLNQSLPLPGRVQTNQRAALYAVVKCLEQDWRPLGVRIDSEYVMRGFATCGQWGQRGWSGDNGDLWHAFASLLHQMPQAHVIMSKVKGHATEKDVKKGLVVPVDKAGNEGADELAGKAADRHRAPLALVEAANHRRAQTEAIQCMFVKVLQDRLEAERRVAGHARSDQLVHCEVEEQTNLDLLWVPVDPG